MKTQKQIKWPDAAKSLESEAKKMNFDMHSTQEISEELRQKCNKLTSEQRAKALKNGMRIINFSKKKTRYCYLVYCNKESIVYSVYSSAKEALYYAEYLIKYRKEFNDQKGLIVNFYHK